MRIYTIWTAALTHSPFFESIISGVYELPQPITVPCCLHSASLLAASRKIRRLVWLLSPGPRWKSSFAPAKLYASENNIGPVKATEKERGYAPEKKRPQDGPVARLTQFLRGSYSPLLSLKWRGVVVTAAVHHGKCNVKWLVVTIACVKTTTHSTASNERHLIVLSCCLESQMEILSCDLASKDLPVQQLEYFSRINCST